MKLLVILLAVVAMGLSQTVYVPKYEDFDVEAILSDDVKLQGYMDCFINRGPCDEVGAYFKKDLHEVAQQACAKCSPVRKNILKRFFEESNKRIPQDYKEFRKIYDPDNKYYASLKKALLN